MSLRFYFGPSDEEKSKALYEEIIKAADRAPRQKFLILVPDQFTMQTQKKLVNMHPKGGILNIDVLSFGRMGHRVLEEVGGEDIPVLDDTGKSLVLQKVASGIMEKLPVLGGHLHKQGYIHEVKSAISEFMQYGISPDNLGEMIEYAKQRGALAYKLKDLQTIYRSFQEYIAGNFITTEETLDVLCRVLPNSDLVRGSVVVLDGFTGFTPIQNRLVREIMHLSAETIVSLTLGEGEDPYKIKGEQELFYLTKKTVVDLEKLAGDCQVARDRKQDVFVAGKNRELCSKALCYLEQNLFRYGYEAYENPTADLRAFEATNPKEEVHQAGLLLQKLLYEKHLAYRDFAVIVGDMEGYAPFVEAEFRRLGIPCFLDRTRGIVLNPLIEYIKSSLKLFLNDFSYESVLHYLRSGMVDLEMEAIDELENYILQTGIRGYGKYSRLFTHKTKQMKTDETVLVELNKIRATMIEQVEGLHLGNGKPASVYVDALYDFLVKNKVQEKMLSYEKQFEERGDLAKAKEYSQIFRLVMELLEQVYALLSEEPISLQEFYDILEAGFGEIQVGIIPQNVDRVLVGDMERTRLQSVKVLFFLGVNDGNIPKKASKGGVISDMDREFLQEFDYPLAPTPRQQMYIQKFYLYLNLTKPTEGLVLSYSRMDNQGKSIRPAYLMDVMKKMYPGLKVECPQNLDPLIQMANEKEGLDYLAGGLRDYIQRTMPEDKMTSFFTLYEVYGEESRKEKREFLLQTAMKQYENSPLSQAVARLIYGVELENSITRLESFAECAYKHFLKYGLSLKERELFGFEVVDMGNIYHNTLDMFSKGLEKEKKTWFDFDKEYAEQSVEHALEEIAATYGETILYSSAKNVYLIKRMKRVLVRTVMTLQEQLKKGVFVPDQYEVSFSRANSLDSLKISLSDEEKMYLQGRIDRVDIAEDDNHVYVKIVDYKSGKKEFDLVGLYYGTSLQLAVYMNAAMELESKKHPDKEILPAAMLYYRVHDPEISADKEMTAEEIDAGILEKLCNKGMVNADETIIDKLDHTFVKESIAIPLARKSGGALTAASQKNVLNNEEFKLISDYVNAKIRRMGQAILKGEVGLKPYENAKGERISCKYCPYGKVCGFDRNIKGCDSEKMMDMTREEVFEKMEKEL